MMMDLEEARRLGGVVRIKEKIDVPEGLACAAYSLPDYRYVNGKGVYLYGLYSEGHVLFVDCGPENMTDRLWFGRIMDEMASSPSEANLFLTHYHYDHMGESLWFNRQGVQCLASEGSAPLANLDPDEFNLIIGAKRGTPLDHLGAYIEFQRNLYFLNDQVNLVGENERITCGDWRFDTIALPGHALGHTGLVSPDRDILFSGDCLGGGPSIFSTALDQHDGAAAIEAWSRLKSLPLRWLMTAHEGTFNDDLLIEDLIVKQIEDLNDKGKRVLDEMRAMSGYVTPCEYVLERKGFADVQKRASLGKYLNALNLEHHFACLEFLYDYEQLCRRVDDDGAVVYEAARFSSFFA